jgi:hypothetical protein
LGVDANESFEKLRAEVAEMLDVQWVPEGYCAPNSEVYPFGWLWDSCFHSIIWAELGDPRSVIELDTALGISSPDGFVPHMNYVLDPSAHESLWGRAGASSITQPPMYGHALAVLVSKGIEVPESLVDRAVDGLWFLLRSRRRTTTGLIELCHPWESGADDSPRWDDLCPGGFELDRWRSHKSSLVGSIERNEYGSPIFNERFAVGSVGFNALVAFNAMELASVSDSAELRAAAAEVVDALETRWSDEDATWVDEGPTERGSGAARSLDGLLPLLVERDETRVSAVVEQLLDPSQHGGACGPSGVHRAEQTYAADRYWRGPAWPQLSYLIWLALGRQGRARDARAVASSTRLGAVRSGLAEYWNADSGEGYGAIPQSWAGLALLMG